MHEAIQVCTETFFCISMGFCLGYAYGRVKSWRKERDAEVNKFIP